MQKPDSKERDAALVRARRKSALINRIFAEDEPDLTVLTVVARRLAADLDIAAGGVPEEGAIPAPEPTLLA